MYLATAGAGQKKRPTSLVFEEQVPVLGSSLQPAPPLIGSTHTALASLYFSSSPVVHLQPCASSYDIPADKKLKRLYRRCTEDAWAVLLCGQGSVGWRVRDRVSWRTWSSHTLATCQLCIHLRPFKVSRLEPTSTSTGSDSCESALTLPSWQLPVLLMREWLNAWYSRAFAPHTAHHNTILWNVIIRY